MELLFFIASPPVFFLDFWKVVMTSEQGNLLIEAIAYQNDVMQIFLGCFLFFFFTYWGFKWLR